MATDSFVNFANIEESTPAYHREYDFFIAKFAAMCFSNDSKDARAIRYAGLKGLRGNCWIGGSLFIVWFRFFRGWAVISAFSGVVWKSATDPLQVSIWEKQHMCKIIPAILLNLEDNGLDFEH